MKHPNYPSTHGVSMKGWGTVIVTVQVKWQCMCYEESRAKHRNASLKQWDVGIGQRSPTKLLIWCKHNLLHQNLRQHLASTMFINVKKSFQSLYYQSGSQQSKFPLPFLCLKRYKVSWKGPPKSHVWNTYPELPILGYLLLQCWARELLLTTRV